jgi:uncharacterized MAPEG superfamily protein
MTTELTVLIFLSILALMLPFVYIPAYQKQVGLSGLIGNRENVAAPTGFAGRGKRVHANLIENLIPFAAVVLTAHAIGVSNKVTIGAALVFLAARLVHLLSYFAGVTVLRTIAHNVGLFATVAIAAALIL